MFAYLTHDAHARSGKTEEEIERIASRYNFFHWDLAFPDVFSEDGSGGFDVVLGNPPWERVKLQEQEWFAARRPEIATAPNAAARKRLINKLKQEDPVLHADFKEDVRVADGVSHLIRSSGRFPLCGRGDVNTFAIFAECNQGLISTSGRAGFIVQSDIATANTYKRFFEALLSSRELVSFFDFVNTEGLFPNVHRTHPHFCLLTISGSPTANPADFAFWNTNAHQLQNEDQHIGLTNEDLLLLNPNTRTCPIFRSRRDALITKDIYRRVPVLIDENRKDGNLWSVTFLRMFDMSNDSVLFRTRDELESDGWNLESNVFHSHGMRYLPLYEAKMLHQYDHRWATYAENGDSRELSVEARTNSEVVALPRYWVPEAEVNARLQSRWRHSWILAYRWITNTTNERTVIAGITPSAGFGNSGPLILGSSPEVSVISSKPILTSSFRGQSPPLLLAPLRGSVLLAPPCPGSAVP